MALTATTAFQPAPEHAAGFGPPHGFRFTFQTAPAKNSQTVIASSVTAFRPTRLDETGECRASKEGDHEGRPYGIDMA
jgi:hypothetical protein